LAEARGVAVRSIIDEAKNIAMNELLANSWFVDSHKHASSWALGWPL
jgi:hypothetical protein